MDYIVTKTVDISLPYVVEGAKVQYRYLFRFGSFKHKLDKEIEELRSVQEDMASRVDADRMNGRPIKGIVDQWLNDVRAILEEADSLQEEVKNKKGCFRGLTCWYPLSKKLEKKTCEMNQLRQKRNDFSEVSLPRAHLPIPYVSSKDFIFSESSKAAFDRIMEGLKDESTNVIGLYGMGGVGKTTLAEQVIKSVKYSKLFDKVVMVVVSQNPDLMAIQDNVAADLGFKFDDDEKDVRTKAGALSLRMEKEKRILIVLDDVWNFIDLPSIGITFTPDQKGCKLLITTRNRGVCSKMNCNKEIPINVMRDSEAWDLFKERAGLDDESPIIATAKKVAKECQGLPIALFPLAMALRNNTPNQWKEALLCLQKSNLPGIKNIDDENAYKCLKVSYDILKGEELKLCFLMCSLFPEDHEIEIEDLVKYAWGLDVCKDADSVEEVRLKVQSSVDHLKDCCLLLETKKENKVKMHDVVRHFALWIVSVRDNFFTAAYIESSNKLTISKSLITYMAVSLIIKGTQELPSGLACPNLKLMLLNGDGVPQVSDTFLKQMAVLKVLTISGCSLPRQLQDISINLQVFHVKFCQVGDISSLGNLKKLEILSFSGSDIRELVDEIGQMTSLRMLDLSSCTKLERIPAGLIQKLSCLEELYVTGSTSKVWESTISNGNDTRGKAQLSELNSLPQLKVLCVDNIGDCLFPYDFVLPNLTRYEILYDKSIRNYPISKTLSIHELNETSLNAFKRFFSTVEHLVMSNNVGIRCIVPDTELGAFNNLISLKLESLNKVVCLIDTTGQKVPTKAFQNVKELTLFQMDTLSKMYIGQIPNGFLQKLEKIHISRCPKLCSIFSQSMAATLVHLQHLKIAFCPDLEDIVEEEEENGKESYLIFTQLLKVSITGCNKLKYIFPICVVPYLQQLKALSLRANAALEQIFKYGNGHQLDIELSHLESLKIRNSLKLINFSGGISSALSFPSLRFLDISSCALQFPPCLEAKQLRVVYLSEVPKEWGHNFLSQLIIGDLPILEEVSFSTRLEKEAMYLESNPNLEEVLYSTQVEKEAMCLESNRLVLGNSTMQKLPQPRHIFPTSVLQNITDLRIISCHKLSYISATLVRNLSMLKFLALADCNELAQIIGNDKEGDLKEENGETSLVFFTKLEQLYISRCSKLKYIFPTSVAPSLQRLQIFQLVDNAELEQIFKYETGNQMPSWSPNPISLQEIGIANCNKLKFVFPVSVGLGGLPKLERLYVERADELEYVFGNETLETENNSVVKEEVVLPRLILLELDDLPSLKGFSVASYKYIFPLMKSMTGLHVTGCPNMTKSFTLSPTHGSLHI